eukprot:SAG11_NODE_14838_length_598_cov_0.699399_1_plen_60_part_10
MILVSFFVWGGGDKCERIQQVYLRDGQNPITCFLIEASKSIFGEAAGCSALKSLVVQRMQ